MSENEDEQENDITHFKFTFSLDDDRFIRRACSQCGLHFKEKADDEDLSHLLAPTFKQIEEKHDIILTPSDEGTQYQGDSIMLCCPYCGHTDESQNMLTDELSQYISRWAQREIVYPAIKSFHEQLDATFNRSRGRRKGMFSISMKVDYDEVLVPVRPISGPELPDMLVVDLRCCRKAIKIVEGWKDRIFCPYCKKEVVLL